MIQRFSGIHTALVTPFTANGDIDFDAFGELLAMQKVAGVHGVVIAGTTGEAATLSVQERESLVSYAKTHASDIAIIAGAGSSSTNHAIELQRAMENAGADATLHVTPYYNKPTQKGLVQHFSAVAKKAKIPVILYNVPGRTCVDMLPATVAHIIKEHDNVIGIKDATTNMERVQHMLDETKTIRENFLVLSGEDASFLPSLLAGGDGIISVVSMIAATEMLALYQCATSGDLLYAQKIARKLHGLCRLVFSHTNPIPIKTILAEMKIIEKSFRLPLCALSDDEEKQLLASLSEFSFIKAFKARGLA